MPEGPSLVLLREEAQCFSHRVVRSVDGSAKIDLQRMCGRRVLGLRTFGKHFLIEFSGFSLRVHMLLFGSYRINERRDRTPTVSLRFDKGELNFYASAVQYIEGQLDDVYDWRGDVLADAWDPASARKKLKSRPNDLVCDALLDQTIFAGVGNIIKNEVLFRIRVHPLSQVGALPPRKLTAMVHEATAYSFDFLAWRRVGHLKRNLLVHRRKQCPACGEPLGAEVIGTRARRGFWCASCQARYP